MIKNGPSLREQIRRNRNKAIGFATLNAVLAAGGYAGVALGQSLWLLLLLLLACPMSVALALNSYSAVRAQRALHIYKSNPVAARIAEMRHFFREAGFK